MQQDIELLKQISYIIETINIEKGENFEKLIKIGNLVNNMSRNLKDKNSIRNKYGAYQKNDNAKIKIEGIFFDGISYLQTIFKNQEMREIIEENDFNNMLSYIKQLKDYLDDIIHKEINKSSRNIIIPFSDILVGFCQKYYTNVILSRVSTELLLLNHLFFINKEEKYVLGRIFTIIGELFRELLEYESNDVDKDSIKDSLNSMVKLRNKFIHCHRRIHSINVNNHENINKLIMKIRKHLEKIIIKHQTNKNIFTIDYKYENQNVFKIEMKELLKLLEKGDSDSKKPKKEIISEIRKEIVYFQSIDSISSMDLERKKYIKQHINVIISEHMKDLETFKHEDYKITAIEIRAIRYAKRYRDTGLAHGIFRYDETDLSKFIYNHISPALPHFDSSFEILSLNLSNNCTNEFLNIIGLKFMKINLYKDAIKCFKMALKRIGENENTNEVQLKYTLKNNKAYGYILSENYSKAQRIYKSLIEEIPFDKVRSSENQIGKDNYAKLLVNMAICLERKGHYNDAIELLIMADTISEIDVIKSSLAIIYYQSNELEKSFKMFKDISTMENCDFKVKLQVAAAFAVIKYTNLKTIDEISDIENLIEEMERLLNEHLGAFKEYHDDQYMIYELIIIEMKVSIILMKNHSTCLTFLIELEKQAKTIIEIFLHDFNSSEYVSRINLVFCDAYLHLCSLENKKEYWIKSCEYFDEAERKLGNTIRTNNIYNKLLGVIEVFIDVSKTENDNSGNIYQTEKLEKLKNSIISYYSP